MGMHISLGIIFQCMLKVYFGKQMTGVCQSWGEIYVHLESSWKERKWLGPVEQGQQNVNLFLAPGEAAKCPTNNSSQECGFQESSRVDVCRGASYREGGGDIHSLFSRRRQQSQNMWTAKLASGCPARCFDKCQLQRAPWMIIPFQSQPHLGTKNPFFPFWQLPVILVGDLELIDWFLVNTGAITLSTYKTSCQRS